MSRRSRASAGKRDRRRPGNAIRTLASDPSHSAAASATPPLVADGQARCLVCRNAVTLTPLGHLRRHRDLFGEDCWNKRREDEPSEYDVALAAEFAVAEKANGINRLSPDGLCFECAKPIPPGRRLCGRCMANRKRS